MSSAASPSRSSTEARVRRFRGSSDRQTAQSQVIIGTPYEVPVPRKSTCMSRLQKSEEPCSKNVAFQSAKFNRPLRSAELTAFRRHC